MEFTDISFILKEQCGVYALYLGDICVYVGQSKKIVRRIQKHRSNGLIEFNRVMVKFCEQDELDQIEFALIRELKPKANISMNIDIVALGLVKRA